MRLIAHISDLHFGTEDPERAAGLRDALKELAPHLIVASGDFTQRARGKQFAAAQAYLKTLPGPQLAIPGNHDIPLFDVLRRFLAPLQRYRRYIHPEVDVFFTDDEMAVCGLNTARSLTWKSGRISYVQMDWMRAQFSSVAPGRFKVLATHHPFIPPPGEADSGIALVGRAVQALRVIDDCGIDLLLAGHLHLGYTGDVRAFYPAARRSSVVVQAGTAISRRVREISNAFNVLTLEQERISVEVRVWKESRFVPAERVTYRLRDEEWRREVE